MSVLRVELIGGQIIAVSHKVRTVALGRDVVEVHAFRARGHNVVSDNARSGYRDLLEVVSDRLDEP